MTTTKMINPMGTVGAGMPFNGDTLVQEEFLKLKELYNVKVLIETGTCLGDTTLWFAETFEHVFTAEIDHDYYEHSKARLKDKENVRYFNGDSVAYLKALLPMKDSTMLFLDAHWEKHCPLLDELQAIADSETMPVIVIHDFYVPGTNLGYDTYHGQRFDYQYIHQKLVNIYRDKGFRFNYNDKNAIGARRGVIFIYPND